MQAEAPLQKVAPHSEEGSVPAASGRHVPGAAGRLQAWHGPSHAERQQVPSTQKLVAQELPEVHAAPGASFGTQAPPVQ